MPRLKRSMVLKWKAASSWSARRNRGPRVRKAAPVAAAAVEAVAVSVAVSAAVEETVEVPVETVETVTAVAVVTTDRFSN